MTLYLTSSHTLGWAGALNPANGLVDELKASLTHPIRCVMISSFPDDVEITDRMAWEVRECFENADLAFDHYEVLDRRTESEAERMLKEANFIFICGGHVPTENDFLKEIKLKQRIKNFNGVLLTISAGSMNCADNVYSPPEMDEEVLDPKYKYHRKGLALTDVNILPHLQTLKDMVLAGKHIINDIAKADSMEHPIYLLNDGSFFIIKDGITELRGESYLMNKGKKRKVCSDGERKLLKNGRLCSVSQASLAKAKG